MKSSSPALRCTASKNTIVCGFLRRAGIAGEPAPALDHAAEPVPLDGIETVLGDLSPGGPPLKIMTISKVMVLRNHGN